MGNPSLDIGEGELHYRRITALSVCLYVGECRLSETARDRSGSITPHRLPIPKVRSVPTAAARHELNPVRFERPVTRSGNVAIVSVAAGQKFTKLPLSQISQFMSGYRPTAAIVGPNLHRQLWPRSVNWPSSSLRKYSSRWDGFGQRLATGRSWVTARIRRRARKRPRDAPANITRADAAFGAPVRLRGRSRLGIARATQRRQDVSRASSRTARRRVR